MTDYGCRVEKFTVRHSAVSSLNFTAFYPNLQFTPGNLFNSASQEIIMVVGTGYNASTFTNAFVLAPSDVHALKRTQLTKPVRSIPLLQDSNALVSLSLATTVRSGVSEQLIQVGSVDVTSTSQHDLRLRGVSFANQGYTSFWANVNTLTPAYAWQDLVTSTAAVLSASVTVFSVVFPFRAVSPHTFRCFLRRKCKGIDRQHSMLSQALN